MTVFVVENNEETADPGLPTVSSYPHRIPVSRSYPSIPTVSQYPDRIPVKGDKADRGIAGLSVYSYRQRILCILCIANGSSVSGVSPLDPLYPVYRQWILRILDSRGVDLHLIYYIRLATESLRFF